MIDIKAYRWAGYIMDLKSVYGDTIGKGQNPGMHISSHGSLFHFTVNSTYSTILNVKPKTETNHNLIQKISTFYHTSIRPKSCVHIFTSVLDYVVGILCGKGPHDNKGPT